MGRKKQKIYSVVTKRYGELFGIYITKGSQAAFRGFYDGRAITAVPFKSVGEARAHARKLLATNPGLEFGKRRVF